MPDKPASLLTNTQRRRLTEDFADVEGAKRRRDRRQIRERVAAGLEDFEHLVDYPDGQLELALEGVDDDELERTLAEMRLVGERIRVLRDIDRDEVIETAREVATGADADADVGTLDRLDLRTRAERREAVERSIADESGPTPWLRRAEAMLKVGLLFLLPAFVLAVAAPDAAAGPAGGIPFLVGGLATGAGLSIVGLRGVKHDLVPRVATLLDDPAAPLRRIRRTWDRL